MAAERVVRIVSRWPTRSVLVRRLFHFFSDATLVSNTRQSRRVCRPASRGRRAWIRVVSVVALGIAALAVTTGSTGACLHQRRRIVGSRAASSSGGRARNDQLLARRHLRALHRQVVRVRQIRRGSPSASSRSRAASRPSARCASQRRRIRPGPPASHARSPPSLRHLQLVVRRADRRRPAAKLWIQLLDGLYGRARPFRDAAQIDGDRQRHRLELRIVSTAGMTVQPVLRRVPRDDRSPRGSAARSRASRAADTGAMALSFQKSGRHRIA